MQINYNRSKSDTFNKFVQFYKERNSMAKAEYRSSIRSKKLITDALVELLDEKPLEKITVTDIVRKADINRGTFYAHYANVNDVVTSMFQNAFEVIKSPFSEPSFDTSADLSQMLIQLQMVMEQDINFYKKIYASDMNMQIYEQISNVLLSFILEQEENYTHISREDFLFYTSFYSGGIMKLYRDWFLGMLPISFDELTYRATLLLNEMQRYVMK